MPLILAGCPFGYDQQDQVSLQEQQSHCKEGEIVVKQRCRINDLQSLKHTIQIDQNFTLDWELSDDKSEIVCLVKLARRAWSGIGFGDSIENKNFVIASIEEEYFIELDESFAQKERKVPIPLDDQSMVKLLGYRVTDDDVQYKFSRVLEAPIQENQRFNIDIPQKFLAVYGRENREMPRFFKFEQKQFILNWNVQAQTKQTSQDL